MIQDSDAAFSGGGKDGASLWQVQFILSCLIFSMLLYLYFASLEQQHMNCHHDWHITNEHIVYLAVYFHFFSEAVGFWHLKDDGTQAVFCMQV